MTPQPTDVTEVGQEAYDAVAPLAKEDEKHGWALLRYVDALVSQAQRIRDQVRDRAANKLGYSILMDVNEAPAYSLEWLSQFAGVDLSKLLRGLKILARNEFINPSFEYDTVGSEPKGWEKLNAAGITATAMVASETWASIGKRAMKYTGKKKADATSEALGPQQKAGAANYIPVEPLKWLNLQWVYNVIKTASEGFTLTVTWYRADGTTEISKTTIAGLTAAVGVHSMFRSVQAPAKAAFARVAFQAVSNVSGQEVEFFVDEFLGYVSEAKVETAIVYIDGDQPHCSWFGTPGASVSLETEEISEEEFNELKRFRIKELPSTKRGTPAAIIAAVQQYLLGDKTVFIKERDGTPWRLTVVTYEAETPSKALVEAALAEQVPAGIVVTYAAVPGATYLLVHAVYNTYKEIGVDKAFLTYNGLRNNVPGT